MITLKRATNGWIITNDQDEVTVVECVNEELDSVATFTEVLNIILQQEGPTTSRYSPDRIVIRREPGDKYEESTEDTPIS